MLEVVKVLSCDGNDATVFIERSTACGECGKCMVGKKNLEITAKVKNDIGAKPGDCALAEMTLSGVMSASFIMYGIPLLAFILGIILGNYVISPMVSIDKDIVSFLMGFGLLFISYIPIKIMDKKGVFRERYEIVLKSVI